MHKKLGLAIVLGTLSIVGGCNGEATNPEKSAVSMDAPPPATVDAHAHPSEGPHHGALVELGNEEFHAEIVHTNDTVTVYILDRSATKPVAIDAQDVTINVVHDNQPEQFKLAAAPEATDESGKSSRFELRDAELVEHIDSPAAAPKLIVSINGAPYRGEVHHDHEGHSHDGHDHDGHQH
jgi:hypothetical protein